MRTLSIIGKDSHTDEHVVGYHTTGDRMKYWGSSAHFGEASGDSSLDQPSSPFPGRRSGAGGGPAGCVDRGSPRRSRGGGRSERHWRGTDRYRNSER
jgi:hypothetical protein